MTSSSATPRTAFVWIWLPGSDEPVVAGRMDQRADRVIFGYGNRYRSRPDAISIYDPELPLVAGPIEPLAGLEPRATLRELFARITFNILSGNTDDHARNHAAFWDGNMLDLTPAYDICPYLRGGGEAVQAMIIGPADDPFRFSQVAGCVERAPVYGLSREDGRAIVERQMAIIDDRWNEVCAEAWLGTADRAMFRRVFPSPYALDGF